MVLLKKKKKKVDEATEEPAEAEVVTKSSKAKKAAKAKHEAEEEGKKTTEMRKTVPLEEVKGLSKASKKALTARGITSLFEVQHRAFKPIFDGKDTVGRAKTGCGKTLAFVLPIVERISADGLSDGKWGRKPLALGMAPTRELAKQILAELSKVADAHGLSASCLYGGTPFGPQVDELRQGVDVVIATPGRLLDHLKRGTVVTTSLKFIVLDEADEMLSMGFQEDVEAILGFCPPKTQKLLFSATMPAWVKTVVAKHLNKDYATVDVVGEGPDNQANTNITHQCIPCSPWERGDTLADLCKVHAGAFGKTLVFTGTKKECDELAGHPTLVQMGAGVLHGDIPQSSREVTMENFRTGKIRLLLATDVAARGLDVPNVDLVVQTRPPPDLDTYVHRAGRTARAGRTGTCVTFYSFKEEYLIRLLTRKKGIPIKRRGPAQPSEIVAQAARDAVRHIDTIHQDNVDAFSKVAEELLAERESSVFLLAASLAAMTGYTQRIKCRSLLSSAEGMVAIMLESEREIETVSKAWYLLRNSIPQGVNDLCKGMSLVKGRKAAVFDCPQDKQDEVLNCKAWKSVKFSLVKELPDIEGRNDSWEDDQWAHSQFQQKRFERIRESKNREKDWKDDGRGTKRSFDEVDGGGKGKGKGKSSGRGGKAARTY